MENCQGVRIKMSETKIASELIKKFLKNEIGNSKRILDIGCGDGVMALYLTSSLNCLIDGIDLDKRRVHRANEKFKERTTKGIALCHFCDSKNINKKFNKNTFDFVLIMHTIHHLTDLADVLLKTQYALKYRGRIFVGEYQRDYGEKRDNCPRFSNKKIKSMLKTAGFGNITDHDIKKFVMITAEKGGIKKSKNRCITTP